MGLMTFFKDAGEKLFGKGPAKAAQEAAAAPPSPETIAGAETPRPPRRLPTMSRRKGCRPTASTSRSTAASSTVTVAGTVGDQATKEKILLCCGNVQGVAGVNDMLIVNAPSQKRSGTPSCRATTCRRSQRSSTATRTSTR